MDGLDFFEMMRQSVRGILITYEPEFLRYAQSEFLSLATIVLAWAGLDLMFTNGTLNDKMWVFVKTMLFISFGYAIVFFYQRPIPGLGISFIHLIIDQFDYFAQTLDIGSARRVFDHLNSMFNKFVAPGAWEITAALIYLVILVVMIIGKVMSIGIIAAGQIISAVLILVGPIFVPFFIFGPLEYLFQGWLKSLISYSLQPVIAYAMLTVFDTFIYNMLTALPPGITSDLYLLYGMFVLGYVGVFIYVFWKIPEITSGMVSGISISGLNPFHPQMLKA